MTVLEAYEQANGCAACGGRILGWLQLRTFRTWRRMGLVNRGRQCAFRRQRIAAAKIGPRNPNWRGEDALPHAQRRRNRRDFPVLGQCACGRKAIDRHHKDGDTGNNSPENIAILCRRCHMKEDGRLARFSANRLSRKAQIA